MESEEVYGAKYFWPLIGVIFHSIIACVSGMDVISLTYSSRFFKAVVVYSCLHHRRCSLVERRKMKGVNAYRGDLFLPYFFSSRQTSPFFVAWKLQPCKSMHCGRRVQPCHFSRGKGFLLSVEWKLQPRKSMRYRNQILPCSCVSFSFFSPTIVSGCLSFLLLPTFYFLISGNLVESALLDRVTPRKYRPRGFEASRIKTRHQFHPKDFFETSL